MRPNEQFIQKAVITTDALVAAGKLNADQAEKFLDYVIEETVLRGNARVVRVTGSEWEQNKLGVGKRVAVPAAEAKDPGLRRGVTTSKISLTPSEIMVPFEIGDRFKIENVEGDSVENHIVKMMGRQTANNIEELIIDGDKLGAARLESDLVEGGDAARHVKDTFLALQDGVLRLAYSGNRYDAAGTNIGASVFSGMIRKMPTKFRRDKKRLRWFMSPDLAQLWQEKVATRATIGGDAALTGDGRPLAFGIPIVEVPLLQFQPRIVEHVVLNGVVAAALKFAPVSNLIVHASTLGAAPTAPYVAGVDYNVNLAAGTVTRIGGGAIADGATVKVTYEANPQIVLTHEENFLVGIGYDVTIEKDRNIYRKVNEYAVSIRMAVGMEEATASVLGHNIGTGV